MRWQARSKGIYIGLVKRQHTSAPDRLTFFPANLPRVSDYRRLISDEAERLRVLHARIGDTYWARYRSAEATAAWEAACDAFHSYDSPLRELVSRAYSEPYTDPDLLEFVIQFLEVDPRYFRSGYHKERMLGRLKQAVMKPQQLTRIRHVLLDAVLHRGGREFRRYCRVAARYADEALIQELNEVAEAGDGKQRSRAKMMLLYLK